MKIVIQRVLEASVKVDQEIVGSINKGALLFVCFEKEDSEDTLLKAVDKIEKLRIYEDDNGKMNHDLKSYGGEILSISQFTLSWNGAGGHRPSFEKSMSSQEARLKYALFNRELRNRGFEVKEGVFGADMKVSLINDGPVTFCFDF